MVSSQAPKWIATARVLRRMGFGTTGTAVDAVVNGDLTDHVKSALAADAAADPGAVATPMPQLSYPAKRPGKGTDQAQRQAFNKQLAADREKLSNWWIERMISVREPVHEKLTLLWHNHFATSAAKVRYASMMAAQNQALRAGHLGDFGALAHTMLTDAAMVMWLDGQSSTAKAPNENLAREFMELFALGHGNGYSESDVREGARALTGWTIGPDGSTVFTPRRHDGRTKKLFGTTGDLNAADFCNIVLAQPKSPEYVTTRLWRQLASDDAPSPDTAARLVDAYGPRRDLRALTAAILTDEEFVGSGPSVIITPAEWFVGAARSLAVSVDSGQKHTAITHPARIDGILKSLGQQPFYPPSVGGWPSGQVWLSTSSAALRLKAADALCAVGDLSSIEQAPANDRVDAAGYLIGVGKWSDASAATLRKLTTSPRRLVTAALNTPEYLTT